MAKRNYSTSTRYNYGSTAPSTYETVYTPPLPSTRQPSKTRKERKKESFEVFKRRFILVIGILSVFISSAIFVWGSAIVSSKQYELRQDKIEVRELKSKVNTKKALIASATNLDHIKLRAITELNMSEPRGHQIKYLDIKKTSYTVIDKAVKE